jgi:hypothetical protein
MSTKTTFKRVALVTVAALGFGVLTTITPASAAVTSFALNTSSQTVVANNTTDSVGALIRIKVTGDTALTTRMNGLLAGETLTAKVTGGPAIRTAATSSPLVIPAGGLAMDNTANDLAIAEVTGQANGADTDWTQVAAGHTAGSTTIEDTTTVSAGSTGAFDGKIGSENTGYFGQEPYSVDTASSKSRYYYVSIMPREGKISSVIDAGVYTITFTLTDTNGNSIGTQTLKIDFVSDKINSGSIVTVSKAGTFTVGTAFDPTTAGVASDTYLSATLKNRDGGVIRGAVGAVQSLTVQVRLAAATSDTLTAGVLAADDGGTNDFGNDTDEDLVGSDGVYGIYSSSSLGTAGTYTITVKHGSASTSTTIVVYDAAGGYTATDSSTGTGVIGTASPWTLPLTTKSATVTVTVLNSTTAVQNYPVTFSTAWGTCAAGDATPVAGATGATTVLTNASGKATLTVTCSSPADGTSATVTWTSGANTGSEVINWAKSKPYAISASPAGPMTVALKSATTVTFTVTDAFGAAVVGEVVNLTVTGSNNTAASPLLVPSATTDAKGQVSYTLTDALAIAAGTDAIKATSTTVTSVTKTLTLTYAATVPVAAAMKVYYDPSETTWTTLVPATTIYESGTTGYTLAQGKNIAKSLVPSTVSASDDVIGFNAYVETAALAAASGLPVSVSISDGGWILSSAGLPATSRTFYTSSTGYTGLINVTATTPGTKTITFTVGTVTSTAALAFTNGTNGSTGRFVTVTAGTANASAVASGNSYPSFTAKVTDGLGNAVAGATLNIVATGVGRLSTGGKTAQWTTDATGSYTFELVSTEEGTATVTVTATTSGAQHSDIVGYISSTAQSNTALAAGNKSATGTVTFAAGASTTDVAQTAVDAAAEATDAANAATDAANAAAEAADAATAAAQDAADAVAALSTQVAEMVDALKKQITALTNLVIKIQKKVKA